MSGRRKPTTGEHLCQVQSDFPSATKAISGPGFDSNFDVRKDFWEYDPATNAWTRKADFRGARYEAVGFSIGNKGYIGTGFDRNFDKDFWEYDPETNVWTRKADFRGPARSEAVGFSIGNKGYIGTGSTNFEVRKDFWEYDPATNAWTRKADFGGEARRGAVGFSIGSKGYLGTGTDGSFLKDFWEYDPATNVWTQKADFGGPARWHAVGFSIDDQGYIGTGQTLSDFQKDFWEYTPGESGSGLILRSAASRRTQGGQTFDINLPLSGTSGVEPRHAGPGGSAFVVFTFSNNVTAVDSTTSNCGTVVSTTVDSSDAHKVIVQGTGACDQQDVIVTLNGVHDDQGHTLASAAVTVGILYGDVNGDRVITLADLTQIRAHNGQAVDASNFFNDINLSGLIDVGDVHGARLQRGHSLP